MLRARESVGARAARPRHPRDGGLSPTCTGVAAAEQRVSAVVEMRRRVGSHSGGAYPSEGKGDTTTSSSAAKIRAAHFSDDLARLMTSSEWRSTETSLEAALLQSPPNPLRIHAFLIQSPVLGVRKLALGHFHCLASWRTQRYWSKPSPRLSPTGKLSPRISSCAT